MKNLVEFNLTARETVSLDDALNLLRKEGISIMASSELNKMIFCYATAVIYEKIAHTTLEEKTCNYRSWPSLKKRKHNYLENHFEPQLSFTMQQYFSQISGVGKHMHA